MTWNRDRIDALAVQGAASDYAAFEAIGLAQMEGASVLDMGCFDGCNTVHKFAPYGNVSRVVGVDPDPASIAWAREATDDARFTWQVGDAATYAGGEGPFDVVYFSHVLQHVDDKRTALDNAWRLLKPGGFVVVKTVDDALMMSYPDPDDVMRRARALYDEHVRPHRAHTAHTDRYLGSKCHALLSGAGFEDLRVKVSFSDTSALDAAGRRALFERVTYYRRSVPEGAGTDVQREMGELMAEWGRLFERADYYFAMPTVVATGRKPDANGAGHSSISAEPLLSALTASEKTGRATDGTRDSRPWNFAAMREADLGEVMAIEIDSFPDPWSPLAFATELRHNGRARYVVAHDGGGSVAGYIGWWLMPDEALVTHIAVAPASRRTGLGSALLRLAQEDAAREGKQAVTLSVRASNAAARRFYERVGFLEAGRSVGYFGNPDDDAILMYAPT